jgi:hypothetical protein
MPLPVNHPAFRGRELTVQPAGWFSGPRLLIDGQPAEPSHGRYTVSSDVGHPTPVELKHNFLDPVPKVKIGDELVEIARELTWYEYLWLAIPLLLVFAGGAPGALVGVLATYASARVFRADLNPFARYAATGLIALAALVAFVVLANVVHLLIYGPE